tara:strand:+ start:414 stop:1028 length:615 start_codon:yes stop_codon:yes gene_type:complete
MGKKAIVPAVALTGLGIATGGFGMLATPNALLKPGSVILGASGGGSSFSGASGLFSGFKMQHGLSAVRGISSIMGGLSARKSAQFQQNQIEQQRRLAKLQADQLILDADAKRQRIKANAIAKAASQGKDISSSRSFMAFLKAQDRLYEDDVSRIRVNAYTTQNLLGIDSRSAKAQARSALVKGGLGVARSFFDDYQDAKESRLA